MGGTFRLVRSFFPFALTNSTNVHRLRSSSFSNFSLRTSHFASMPFAFGRHPVIAACHRGGILPPLWLRSPLLSSNQTAPTPPTLRTEDQIRRTNSGGREPPSHRNATGPPVELLLTSSDTRPDPFVFIKGQALGSAQRKAIQSGHFEPSVTGWTTPSSDCAGPCCPEKLARKGFRSLTPAKLPQLQKSLVIVALGCEQSIGTA